VVSELQSAVELDGEAAGGRAGPALPPAAAWAEPQAAASRAASGMAMASRSRRPRDFIMLCP
jgi:hypothetical protein